MKHFKLEELVDKNTFETMGNKAWGFFTEDALFALDDLREFFNAHITINDWHRGGSMQWRGYRSPSCPIGAKSSQHRLGNAFDCTIQGHTAEEARAEILAHQDDELLKRIMRLEADKSWVHFDCKEVTNRIKLFEA